MLADDTGALDALVESTKQLLEAFRVTKFYPHPSLIPSWLASSGAHTPGRADHVTTMQKSRRRAPWTAQSIRDSAGGAIFGSAVAAGRRGSVRRPRRHDAMPRCAASAAAVPRAATALRRPNSRGAPRGHAGSGRRWWYRPGDRPSCAGPRDVPGKTTGLRLLRACPITGVTRSGPGGIGRPGNAASGVTAWPDKPELELGSRAAQPLSCCQSSGPGCASARRPP